MGESTAHRVSFLNRNDKPFHVVISQQFDRESIDSLCHLADMMRSISETKEGMQFLNSLLRHKRAMLYFTQPSTRTFLSFASACQIVGIPYNEVRDASVSSEIKGESEADTVRVLSQYFDMIIMRHPGEGFAEDMARNLSIPIINGGSGRDQHPTQALLDIYTLKRCFAGDLSSKTITFVGDLKRGRTVRSLSYLLCKYPNLHLNFVAPPNLQMGDDILDHLNEAGTRWLAHNKLTNDLIAKSDALYMTRLQDEWGDEDFNYEDFSISAEQSQHFKPRLAIMHPLPRRQELDRALDNTPYAKYWDQVKNGMWMRSAILAYIFGMEPQIMNHYYEVYLR